MERIFLSFHFDEAGKNLANLVEDLLSSHGIRATTGAIQGGEPLSDSIQEQIRDCDALICLFTERDENLDRDWIRDERAYAHGRRKKTLAVVQSGSNDGGFFEDNEQVRFDLNDPLPAFLKLSGIIGKWKREGGKIVRAVLKPKSIGNYCHNQGSRLEYRTWLRQETTEWREAVAQKSGQRETIAFFNNVKDYDQIEVRLLYGNQKWESGASEQLLNVQLEVEE